MRLKTNQLERGSASRNHGFSLIELLIVVAVILIIMAIAIPNFLRARITANETAAVANGRTITTASVVYSTTYGVGFAAQLSYLGGAGSSPTSAGLIDDILASGSKSGYNYSYTPGPPDGTGRINSYTLNIDPATPGSSGNRYFFANESGVIRFSLTGAATSTDPPIQ